jgi:hypothetical protein
MIRRSLAASYRGMSQIDLLFDGELGVSRDAAA